MAERHQRFLYAVLGWVLILTAGGAEARALGSDDERTLSWPAAETTLRAGRTQVLTFEVDPPAVQALELEAIVQDPERIELISPARVLGGGRSGALRLRALEPGSTRLVVGGSELVVRVLEAEVGEASLDLSARIVSPIDGAVAWGRFAIGVEVGPGPRAGLPAELSVVLRGSDGTEREPVARLSEQLGRTRRFVFELDASEQPPGPLSLTAVARDGREELVRSPPLELTIARAPAEERFEAECEAANETERPEAYGALSPRTGNGPDASGGGYVVCYAANPSFVARVEVERAGRFQLAARARGDFAAGGFPSIAWCVDHPARASTAGRIVDTRWRRHLVGVPVELDAGEHLFVLRFPNDAAVPRTADRNLFLDTFELLRVDEVVGASSDPEGAPETSMMSMEMSSSSSMQGGNSAAGGEVLVAFERSIDGLVVNGRFELHGVCRWSRPDAVRAPRVELRIDDQVVARQRSALPLFALDPATLGAGWHDVQLVATLDSGERHATPVQRIRVPHELPAAAARRAAHVVSVEDEAWGDSLDDARSGAGELPGHHHADLPQGETVELILPEALEGEHRVVLHARGPDYPWAAVARIELVTDERVVSVGEAESWGYWNYRDGGLAVLPPGPKRLRITFDGFREKKPVDGRPKVRGIWLRNVALKAEREGPDRVAPQVALIHPAAGDVLFGADALVAEVLDDDRIVSAELLIDGRPSGCFARPPSGLGRLVIPFALRELPPGEHALALRVADAAGNQGQSEERLVRVAATAPSEPTRYARALRLLDRFAYGPEEAELAALLSLGERAWLEDRLAPFGAREQAALDVTRVYLRDLGATQVRVAALRHALRTTNPVRARFVLWLDDHFSTWLQKAGAESAWQDHLALARLGPAPFEDCLWASVTSPAMLYFLDQQRSYAGALNENYARELLELHTLGVDGGYTQADVTALASLLTGITVSEEAGLRAGGGFTREFRYDPMLGERSPREVLGLRFDAPAPDAEAAFDRVRQVVELLAAHPSTARHIARKLAEHYVAVPAPDELVDELAEVFLTGGGDLRQVLLALASSPVLQDPALPERACTPLEYGLRFARVGGAYQLDSALNDYLARAGMGVFDRATPDGWPEGDDAWVDTNTTLQRWRLPADHRWPIVRLVPAQQRARPLGEASGWHQGLVDAIALRLCGRALAPESNAAALAMLVQLDLPDGELIERAAVFVARTPEANLR